MPLFSSITGLVGAAAVGIPDYVGQVYNDVLKAGSWVISSEAMAREYSRDGWKKLKNEWNRYMDFERDPSKLLWFTNLLLRENPIRMPSSMSQEEWGFLKTLWEITKRGDGDAERELIYAEHLNESNHKELLEGDIPLAEEYYTAWTSPYSTETSGSKSPIALTQNVMSALGMQVGYRQWAGLSLGSDHMWTIQLIPHGKYCPALPSYKLADVFNAGTQFSFGKNCPATSYSIQFGNQNTKQIDLANSGAIHVPISFSFDIIIDIDIVDDMHGSMKQYMNKYMNTIYDQSTNSAFHYKEVDMEVRIIVWKDGYVPKHEFSFLAVPYNYTVVQQGDENAATEFVKLSFSVVGLKRMNDSTINSAPGSSVGWKSTKWTDVVLAPNNSGTANERVDEDDKIISLDGIPQDRDDVAGKKRNIRQTERQQKKAQRQANRDAKKNKVSTK